jgi:hypothetical protein
MRLDQLRDSAPPRAAHKLRSLLIALAMEFVLEQSPGFEHKFEKQAKGRPFGRLLKGQGQVIEGGVSSIKRKAHLVPLGANGEKRVAIEYLGADH